MLVSKETIGKRLRELRGDTPREEVAIHCGTSVSAIQMYENGERIPRDEIKVKLATYYNKTIEELFFTPELHGVCS